MKQKPFIKLFTSPRGFYFFDVNKDTIVNVSKNVYDYLDNKLEFSCLGEDDVKAIESMKEKGYLSDKHISEIRHPELDNLRYELDNNCHQIVLQVTQACNLVCYYCPYANKSSGIIQREHSNKVMSWEVAKKSIDFYYEHSGDSDEANISFYGGEPLIAFDLIKKCVLYSEELFFGKKISFSMTSNATLFNEESIKFVTEHNFNLLFSIDGPQKIHDINRKKVDGSGSFEEAYSNMCKIADIYQKENRQIAINMVLNPENDLDEIISLLDDEAFKKYDINVQTASADDDMLEKDIVATESYITKYSYHYFIALLDYLKIVDGLKVSHMFRTQTQNFIKKFERFKKGAMGLPDTGAPGGPCIPGARRLFVNVHGDLFPCERVSEVSKVMNIGNVFDGFNYENASDILNIASITEAKCKNCYALSHCLLCARCADDGDCWSAEKRMHGCSETYREFDSDVRWSILQKESCTVYRREQNIK